MIRFTSFPSSSQTALLFSLLLITSFVAACGGAKQNSASDSAPASSASSSGASAPASAAASAPGGAFEGAITTRFFAGDQTMEIKQALKGSKMRVETPLSPGSAQVGVMLMDISSGTQTMLIPQNKTYMTLNLSEMVGQMAGRMTDGKDASGDFPKITSTGKTETIAGYTCQHWLVGDKQDTDVCMAKGLGYYGGGQAGSILDQLKNLAFGDKMKKQIEANPEFAKFVEGGAFPLKMSQIVDGQSKTILEVTSVE